MNCPVKTYLSATKNSPKIRPKRPETDIELDFYESDAEKEGIVCCFAQIENIKRQFLTYGEIHLITKDAIL